MSVLDSRRCNAWGEWATVDPNRLELRRAGVTVAGPCLRRPHSDHIEHSLDQQTAAGIDPARVSIGRDCAHVELSFGPEAIIEATPEQTGIVFRLYERAGDEQQHVDPLIYVRLSFDGQLRPHLEQLEVRGG